MKKWLVALLLLPLATAQTGVLSDPAGDISKSIADNELALPAYDALDLRSLSMDETLDAFHFYLEIEDPSTTLGPIEGSQFQVELNHNGQQFRVDISAQEPIGGSELQIFGFLRAFDPAEEQWYNMRNVPVVLEDSTFEFTLQRDWLLDETGAEPFPGRALDDLKVSSFANLNGFQAGGNPLINIQDQMPDSGNLGIWAVQKGLQQEGHLRLQSNDPIRASNGEATTFVFVATLQSTVNKDELVTLKIPAMPPEWIVQLPADELLIPANESLELAIVVSVPFKHVHGALDSFILEASSVDGSSVGRIELGIRYNEIAQPAGHHDTLYLHTEQRMTNVFQENLDAVIGTTNSIAGTMNTEENYALDAGEDYAAFGNGVGAQGVYQWNFALAPKLVMGLDFDLERAGNLDILIKSAVTLEDATPRGGLYYTSCATTDSRSCETISLGTFVAEAAAVGATGTAFDLLFTPSSEANFVPYAPGGASLRLTIQMEVPSLSQSIISPPQIVPGGSLTLPLNEYHDPVSDNLNTLSGIDFVATSQVERFVNPAETALFNFTLFNTGLVKETFTLDTSGGNDWARLLGASEVTLSPGDERRVAVAVEVPEDALDSVVADFVVRATSNRDASLQAVVPFRVVVDGVFDQPNDADLILATENELGQKSLPGFAIPMVIVALVLARRNEL